MQDYLRFCRELIALRNHQPALRSEAVNVFHVHDQNRVIAYQRWVVGSGPRRGDRGDAQRIDLLGLCARISRTRELARSV